METYDLFHRVAFRILFFFFLLHIAGNPFLSRTVGGVVYHKYAYQKILFFGTGTGTGTWESVVDINWSFLKE